MLARTELLNYRLLTGISRIVHQAFHVLKPSGVLRVIFKPEGRIDVEAHVLLCDYAQVPEGKLTVIGAGWTFTSQPAPTAVGVLIEVPWEQCTRGHAVALSLKTQDGAPVAGPDGVPIQVINVIGPLGHPPALPEGSAIPSPMAVNVGPLPLASGSRYVWELSIDGDTRPEWRVAFNMRPSPVLAG